MVSDSAGMRESGGMQPQPKTFRPEDLGGAPVFRPREPAVPGAGPEKPAPTRMILIVGGAVLFLLVAAAVFYFFVRPILSPSAEILPAETAPPAAETPLPVQVPPESETPPAPAALPTPPVPVFTHQSLLNPVPKLTETLTLSKLELAELTSAIGKATGDTQPAGSVKELVLANAALGSGEALGVLLPDLDKNFSDANLEKDFTAFAYYDANGVWPGYVFQLKSGIEAGAAKSAFVGIEASKNWPNFYLVNPGTPAAFKDGAPISGNAVRYLSYTKAGASFNYSFLGNYLVLSTSYSGFKEAAKLLGF
ncbi:MAG: hypothetical protein HYW37_01650 [Candidatus Colwellbacteria bacterium]|nr:hypothetical protein [Candidatus Colwellbacteria bacterium]